MIDALREGNQVGCSHSMLAYHKNRGSIPHRHQSTPVSRAKDLFVYDALMSVSFHEDGTESS